MVYQLVKWLSKLTFASYFRKTFVKGGQHLEATGPVIFVANHPSTFMDPMVVASFVKRPIHFLVAAEYFGKGIKAWIFRKPLHMLPIYRPNTMPGDTQQNKGIFVKCFDLLERGGAILVFPEGNSITEKRVRKLKTGVARIALGAIEDRVVKDVSIIPIGLNYTNPHRFRSELFINVGLPISARFYSSDPSAVNTLTLKIEEQLKEISLHIPDESLDQLIKSVLILEINNLRKDPKFSIDNALIVWQKLVLSITQLKAENRPSISIFEERLYAYLKKIKSLGISDTYMAELAQGMPFLLGFWLLIVLPIAMTGLVLNGIPYYLTVFVFRRMKLFEREGFTPERNKVRPAFKGSVAVAIGMLIFISYYGVLGTAIAFWFGSLIIAVVSIPLTYLAGMLTLKFLNWYYTFSQKIRIKILKKNKTVEMADLAENRADLVSEINNIIRESRR